MKTVPEQNANSPAAEGRDTKGRFAPGNPGGPGNPFARKVAQLRKALVNFITEEDMKEIALVLREKATMGNLEAIKLLYQYVLGKPLPPADPDRLDVDEWQKLQEQARPPAEMTEVMQRLPADMACNLTQIAWPCAVEQNFSAPFLANLKEMDERDARLQAATEKRAANKPSRKAARRERVKSSSPACPSPNDGNGDPARGYPSPNDGNGDLDPSDCLRRLVGEAMARSREGEGQARPSVNGDDGSKGREGG